MKLSERIDGTHANQGEMAIFYLAQAGFCFKNSQNIRIFVDPYLSDCCNRLFGFKRIIAPLLSPEEVRADILASTHAHFDHLDTDALPILARHPETFFIGARDCEKEYIKCAIPPERYRVLAAGENLTVRGVEFKAVYADHGKLAPEAIGLVIKSDDIIIYIVGDSAYRPQKILKSLGTVAVDIMIAPINGKFGNLDARDACRLAAQIKPKVLIASHFWMFIEHGGDPEAFLEEAKNLPRGVQPLVMAPAECLRYSKVSGILESNVLEIDGFEALNDT